MKSRLSLPGCTCLHTHFQEHSPEPALLAEYTNDVISVGIAEMFTLKTAASVTQIKPTEQWKSQLTASIPANAKIPLGSKYRFPELTSN